ncbi:MAG: hypothetical protein IJF40_01555 [Clostridia bacterium]|nr:hypothetical protein [Clostridia bacterium]
MNRRVLKIFAVVIVFVLSIPLIFGGCSDKPGETDETTSVSGETPEAHSLKLPYSQNDKLNPFTAESMLNQSVCELIYDGLFSLDKNYNAKPMLASNYSQSGRTLTVTLGSVKFSDGSSVTPSDVVASFNSAKESPAYKSSLAGFGKATVSGNSVVFELSADDPYAVNCLTFAVTKGGSTEEKAVGSGRYVLDINAGGAVLKARSSRTADFSPKIKQISLYGVQDVNSLKYTLAIGNISFAFDDLRLGNYTRFSASTASVLMNNMVFMTFNKGNSALASEKVRQAISLLVDRSKIADTAFQGHAKAAYTPFNPDWNVISGKDYTSTKAAYTPSNPDWNAILGEDYTITTDIEAVEKLLDEAGYKTSGGSVRSNGSNALSFKLLVNKDNAFKTQAADYIKEMLKKANISVTVESLEEKAYKSAVASGKYDMYIGEIKLSDNMNLSPILLPKGAVSYGINTSGASSTAYAAMLAGTLDVYEFLEIFNSDLPFLPLCYRSGIAAYTRSISFDGDAHINDIYADIESWQFIS